MAIFNHLDLIKLFPDNGMLRDIAEKLEIYNVYHCLRKANIISVSKNRGKLGNIPESFFRWIKVCDGGLLFDTVMLSLNGYDRELDLNFETFDEYNSPDAKSMIRLPEEYLVFAIRSYGDPICFNSSTGDGKVYLWNMEQYSVEETWDSFEAWLADEIETAIRLVEEEVLDPLVIKLGDAK